MVNKALEPEVLKQQMTKLPGWEIENNKIRKKYKWDSYLEAINFANVVAAIAEHQQHHPDIFIGYKEVIISFTSHDAGHKISAKDVHAAATIEALPLFKK